METPRRIVSLVPSLTELVCWLGGAGALAGRTRFCDSPAEIAGNVPAIGGTKDPGIARILALAPDLVLANREENRREDVEALSAAGVPVLVTDPCSVDEALRMIAELGDRLGLAGRAGQLIAETNAALAGLPPSPGTAVFVPVWKHPLMGLGAATYGHDLIVRSGGRNVFEDRQRYPPVSMAEVRERSPAIILLPDEPYRFGEIDAAEYSDIASTRLVDGRMLWWYGPRLPSAIRALSTIFMEARQL